MSTTLTAAQSSGLAFDHRGCQCQCCCHFYLL